MQIDLSQDWKVCFDGLENLTYYVKTGEGTYNNGMPVSGVYWEELNEFDYKRNPDLLEQTARAVHMWTSFLKTNSGTFIPKMDDMVYDQSNNQWLLTRVEGLDLDANGVQRWRCPALLSNGSSSGLVTFSGFPPAQGNFTGVVGG